MALIGRIAEQNKLAGFMKSGKAEFVVMYGRRRVGKTYLVDEFFGRSYAFQATGLAEGGMREQLAAFHQKLGEFGCPETDTPKSWLEAFARLKGILSADDVVRDEATGRRIVFIDEMPWLDTPRSNFKAAIEFFWNDWASKQPDLMLIVCGSATSWIVRHLLESKGGFHNRVTRIIHLRPFTLKECCEYYRANGMAYSMQMAVESYMVFGGIPFYLDLLDRSQSLSQSVDELCFREDGQLRNEFARLFATLFKHADAHMRVVRELSKKKCGLTRTELRDLRGMKGTRLTTVLAELEQCGFIRSYRDISKRKKGTVFQLIDSFALFHLQFIEPGSISSWMRHIGSPSYRAWSGLAFELVCLNNSDLILEALGISGIETRLRAWKSETHSPGAQIDLLIDRADGVISVCEMKYSGGPYVLTSGDARNLRNKLAAFASESHTRKALHLTLVTLFGAVHNAHYNELVQREVSIEKIVSIHHH